MTRRVRGAIPRRRAPLGNILVRICIYVLAAIVFFVLRGRIDWKRFAHRTTASSSADTTLTLAGADVAPLLVDELARRYRMDYPRLRVETRGGATAQALQDLVNGRAGAVFLARPPDRVEQAVFTRATGDTAIWYPVALAAVLVVSAPDRGDTVVSLEELKQLSRGRDPGGRRLYVPDPNSGLWWAFLSRLGLPGDPSTPIPGVVFLQDDDTVIRAVLADAGSLGVVSSFGLRRRLSAWGARAMALRTAPGAPAVSADNVTLSTGAYPLWCYLYAGCLGRGGMQGSYFITYLTSARGQRQIEQTPYLPARKVSREVFLRRTPPGS